MNTLTITTSPTISGGRWHDAAPCDAVRRVEDAIQSIQRGSPVVVADGEDRENEGDLIIAAEHATPSVLNFMITNGRGLLCVALTEDRAIQLRLPYMVTRNEDDFGTAFTVSVDAATRHGVTTGISAFDRSRTIEMLVNGTAADLQRPGHMFPVVARNGGILERQGHTESAVELARLAGLRPMGVMIEILRPNGDMARRPDLLDFCRLHQLSLTSTDDIRSYVRHARESGAGVPNEA